MAQIVLGMATSHTPMLNAPPTDWPRFIERDSRRPDLLDTDGRLTTYEAQLRHAPADIMAEIAPERMQARHQAVQGAIARLGRVSRQRAARRADRRRRRPGRAVPSRQHARHSRLLRRDDPERAARPRLQGAGLGAAGDGALVRGKGAARLSGRCRAGAPSDRRADRPRIRHRRLGPGARRARARGTRSALSTSG